MKINQIIQGDCLKVLKDIPDKSIDLLYTDPPYNITFNGGGSCEKKYDYRKQDIKNIGSNTKFTLIPFLEAVKPKLKNFHAYIWMAKNTLPETLNWIIKNKYNWNILIWHKINPVPAYNNTYLPDVEYCVFIRSKNCYFNSNLKYEAYRKVFTNKVNNTGLGHPTIKPLWIVEKMLKVSSREGDLILDPYLGSGTTAVAAKKLKRNYIGIEISKEYCEMADLRIKSEGNILL